MPVQKLDPGQANHSPSSELMTLVDIDHMSDFKEVVQFLEKHVDDVIAEVHGFDKLYIDNGKVMLNAPPAPESGDDHGHELLRTLSEKELPGHSGVTLRREFKVHDLGPDDAAPGRRRVEIREDVVRAPEEVGKPPAYEENVVTVSIARKL